MTDLFMQNHAKLVAGVDEAGRGPWAGPVTAGAVILDPARPIRGLTDSKKLTANRREALEPVIQAHARYWCVVHVSHEDIDRLNIRLATHLAMRLALIGLVAVPDAALIDGNDCPADLPCPGHTIIRGDLTEPAISAASILAKVSRDRLMRVYDSEYPDYGFAAHKGYGTAAHTEALGRYGPCAIHRASFAPVRKAQNRA